MYVCITQNNVGISSRALTKHLSSPIRWPAASAGLATLGGGGGALGAGREIAGSGGESVLKHNMLKNIWCDSKYVYHC